MSDDDAFRVAMREAEGINPEDLEAAGEFYDRLHRRKPVKLQMVTGRPFRTTCIKCEEQCGADTRKIMIFADLDGEAFKAYYCADCALTNRRCRIVNTWNGGKHGRKVEFESKAVGAATTSASRGCITTRRSHFRRQQIIKDTSSRYLKDDQREI